MTTSYSTDLAYLKQTAYLNYHASPGWPGSSDMNYILLTMVFPLLFLSAHAHFGVSGLLGELLTFVIPFGLAFAVPTIFMLPVWFAIAALHLTLGDINFQRDWNLQRQEGDRIKIISEARSITIFLTSLAIFAVDFPEIFPRSLCKTELYGFSLMDVGVGLTIFFSSANSQRHIARVPRNGSVCHTLVRIVPALVLGLSKLLFTREADYYVSSSEYGVHWNFFFTVSVISLLGSLVPRNTSIRYHIFLAMLCSTVSISIHLYEPFEWDFFFIGRTHGFIAANREGLLSCLGYFSLHLFGAAFGSSIIRGEFKSVVTWFILFYLASTCAAFLEWYPCRRLANLPFVWSSCTTALFILLLASLVDKTVKPRVSLLKFQEGILKAPLSFFLCANALTGLTNMYFNTLEASFVCSVIALSVYSVALWFISLVLYRVLGDKKDKQTM